MKIYTATGDGGETSLVDGRRVYKDNPRVAAYGEVDELNSTLGWCRVAADQSAIAGPVEQIQQELFHMGAELATPAETRKALKIKLIGQAHCRQLEQWIDEATAAVDPLQNFVLPGGCELAARLHMARCCCRRVERAVVGFGRNEEVRPEVLIYLNRLSDLLFVWARLANHEARLADHIWKPQQ